MNSGLFDLSLLRTISLDAHFKDKVRLSEVIEKAIALKAWIIFNTHDIDESPSNCGCTPQLFESVVSGLAEQGIEILPVKSALAKVASELCKNK